MLVAGGTAFSFYEKDIQRMQDKKRRIEAHRNDKTRFQVRSYWLAAVLGMIQPVHRLTCIHNYVLGINYDLQPLFGLATFHMY